MVLVGSEHISVPQGPLQCTEGCLGIEHLLDKTWMDSKTHGRDVKQLQTEGVASCAALCAPKSPARGHNVSERAGETCTKVP